MPEKIFVKEPAEGVSGHFPFRLEGDKRVDYEIGNYNILYEGDDRELALSIVDRLDRFVFTTYEYDEKELTCRFAENDGSGGNMMLGKRTSRRDHPLVPVVGAMGMCAHGANNMYMIMQKIHKREVDFFMGLKKRTYFVRNDPLTS